MGTADIDQSDVDELGRNILTALQDRGGESDSRTLKEDLGGVGTTPFNYRVKEYLEPYGLVETHQPEGEPGRVPPKRLELTDVGEDFLDSLADAEPTDVKSRVDRLEKQVETLQRENQELQEQNRELQEALERSNAAGLGDELQALRSNIDQLQNRVRSVETHPVVASDVSPALIDAGVVLGNTCKKVLESELGEERVEKVRSETSASFEEDGDLLAE